MSERRDLPKYVDYPDADGACSNCDEAYDEGTLRSEQCSERTNLCRGCCLDTTGGCIECEDLFDAAAEANPPTPLTVKLTAAAIERGKRRAS